MHFLMFSPINKRARILCVSLYRIAIALTTLIELDVINGDCGPNVH